MYLEQSIAKMREEARREYSEMKYSRPVPRYRPQIWARPHEIVGLRQHNERSLAVKAKMDLELRWQFDRLVVSLRNRVGDRQHCSDTQACFDVANCNNHTGSVLETVGQAGEILRPPQI